MELDTQEMIDEEQSEVEPVAEAVVDLEVFWEALRAQEIEDEWASIFDRHGVDEETKVDVATAVLVGGVLKPGFYQRVFAIQRAKPWPGEFYAELHSFFTGFSLKKKTKRKPAGEKKPRAVKKKTVIEVVQESLRGEEEAQFDPESLREVDQCQSDHESLREGEQLQPVESEDVRKMREQYAAACSGQDQSTWGRVLYHALSGETTYDNLADKVGIPVERLKRTLAAKYDVGWVTIHSDGERVVARLARSL